MADDLLKLQFQGAAEFAQSKGELARAQIFTRLAETVDSIEPGILDAYYDLFEDLPDQETDQELMSGVGRTWVPETASEYVKEFISRRTGGA
ncbi:hypothetical protein GA0061099_1005400 [Bradyrhizobium yuanmingense]|uniref:Uncharacterized protein n=2 Tax=Bradyrhizobium yuanmingense TaxID=108015 RepID=A0A1C3W816_9BRAD|nr:hypothetical protein IQ15_02924 [Bradyrhizobium yuanmingense]SCB35958.1 hypothetical protein GA0061099_1005400 [Bradyrhizobium yuanmingense]